MNRVFIASPLRGNIERNQDYATWCMRDSLKRGEAPFVPHLLFTRAGANRVLRAIRDWLFRAHVARRAMRVAARGGDATFPWRSNPWVWRVSFEVAR